jgi:L-alanine-DL-glutamate epimerase-like enolase superfamily enzyme
MRVSLHAADLTYANGLTLHTATSGSVPALRALYLRLEHDGMTAIGEVRVNIAYLNHLSEAEVTVAAIDAVGAIDWDADPAERLACFETWAGGFLAPVRMLIDMALHDLATKRGGISLADWLGRTLSGPLMHLTNQTLFFSSFNDFAALANAYVGRGFTDLKVRVGLDLDDDLRRICYLRQRFGDRVTIAADANGQWSTIDAIEALNALAPHHLAYVEQPIAPGDWHAIADLAEASPIRIMLDESAAGIEDIDRICRLKGSVSAHLKLVKLGGVRAALAAARQLSDASVPFMIGQMNEGGAATAAALHVAVVSRPSFAELYGADGLIDDPVSGLTYHDGCVEVDARPGLGVGFDATRTTLIKEF